MALFGRKKNETELILNEISKIKTKIETSDIETTALNSIRTGLRDTISGTYENADTQHDIYSDYGYPDIVDFSMMWNLSRRMGIASNIINKPVDTCFLTLPNVIANESFLKDLGLLDGNVKLWERVKGVDKRQRVGRYAGLYMQIRDGKRPHEQIEGKLNGINSLAKIIPLYESQLEVKTVEQDISSENYGMPTMYQYNMGLEGDRNEDTAGTYDIHPSRVVIFSEGADDGSIYGIPALESPFNSLLDLRKIIGGGAEGFYRNASQNLIFKTSNGSRSFNNQKDLDDFNKAAEEFTKKRMRKHLYAPGMDITPVSTSMMSPKDAFTIALNDIAASTGIPSTILIGQQTGRLASDEDTQHFLSEMQSRRVNYLTSSINDVIDFFINTGILPFSEYEIEWDDLQSASDSEKLANANLMSDINVKNYNAGGDLIFSTEQILEAAGYDPEDYEEIEADDETIVDEDEANGEDE